MTRNNDARCGHHPDPDSKRESRRLARARFKLGRAGPLYRWQEGKELPDQISTCEIAALGVIQTASIRAQTRGGGRATHVGGMSCKPNMAKTTSQLRDVVFAMLGLQLMPPTGWLPAWAALRWRALPRRSASKAPLRPRLAAATGPPAAQCPAVAAARLHCALEARALGSARREGRTPPRAIARVPEPSAGALRHQDRWPGLRPRG